MAIILTRIFHRATLVIYPNSATIGTADGARITWRSPGHVPSRDAGEMQVGRIQLFRKYQSYSRGVVSAANISNSWRLVARNKSKNTRPR